MSIISWRQRYMLGGHSLLFSLLIACVLAMPTVPGEVSSITLRSPQQPDSPGLTPQTGTWAYFTTPATRIPIIDKWAVLPIGMPLMRQRVDIASKHVSALGQAALPQEHRLQYMIPMYFSTYV